MLSGELLHSFKVRHKDISQSEKVGTVKTIFNTMQRVNPVWANTAESLYSYLRIIDDCVDESPETTPVREILKVERGGLLGKQPMTSLQQEYLERPLREMFGAKNQRVRMYLDKILSGMMVDLNVRHTQQPLTEMQMKARNYRVTYPSFAIFLMASTGVDPKTVSGMVETMHDVGSYDNVSDIFEDLPNGLVLIEKNDLVKYDLSFENGQPLDIDKLLTYNIAKRREVRSRLRKSSSAVFGMGLPAWMTALMYTYLYTRSVKLFIGLPRPQELVYKAPLDAIKSQAVLS